MSASGIGRLESNLTWWSSTSINKYFVLLRLAAALFFNRISLAIEQVFYLWEPAQFSLFFILSRFQFCSFSIYYVITGSSVWFLSARFNHFCLKRNASEVFLRVFINVYIIYIFIRRQGIIKFYYALFSQIIGAVINENFLNNEESKIIENDN